MYDGRNLLPVLRGESEGPLHEVLFWDGLDDHWAVREGPWKLVYSKQGTLELFNLAMDIGEQRDLADDEPAVVKRLAGRYRSWRDQMALQIGTVGAESP